MTNIRLTDFGRALGVALALAAAVGAEPAAGDPPAVYAARRAEGEAHRDWRLRCFGGGCAIAIEVAGADGAPVLSVEARGPGDAGALRVATPLPLFLPDGLELVAGDAPPVVLAWRTCGAAGCEAVAPLAAGLLAALRRAPEAEATLTLAEGLRVRLPVSLLGFSAAWEAMAARAPAPGPDAPEAAQDRPRPEPRPKPGVSQP